MSRHGFIKPGLIKCPEFLQSPKEAEEATPLTESAKISDTGVGTDTEVIQIKDWATLETIKVTLTLDPATVPHFLTLCDHGKTVTWSGQEDIVKIETLFPYVLCKERFSSGKHSWEVFVKGC
ncbi:hypothetical protein AALO_G00094450 [Alosa alosa]|uniref:Uncharacterized protein n=1 Tax=Alosa alosa TaxID=278164 RepID=A0AAV6GSE0_9TELE|nr:hypothetical protein AALO_G00094450 [Alosa alosa]